MDFINEFHFLRPYLLLLLPVGALIWLYMRKTSNNDGWSKILPGKALEALRIDSFKTNPWLPWLVVGVWCLAVVAAAGPSWIKQQTPLITNSNAVVIVLDLSPSMLATDLQPNRLARAKLKVVDALNTINDGQAALVAYAGDAHVVSPFTDDPSTIEALLPALFPSTMPVAGSNTEQAVELAVKLVSDAQLAAATILLITDGIDQNAFSTIRKALNGSVELSILGVASNSAAPIPSPTGGFIKDGSGSLVLADLNANSLARFASSTYAKFAQVSPNDSDLNYLLNTDAKGKLNNTTQNSADEWQDMGHWLIIAVLMLMLPLFRKGQFYVLLISISLGFIVSPTSFAQDDSSVARSFWRDLWQTPDQQGQALYDQQQYEQAANTFSNNQWAGAAHYQNNNFDAAIEQFSADESVSSLYNKATSQVLNQQFEEAIEGFNKVLKQQPEHADAAHNKKIAEELLKQQQEQQEQQNDQNSQSDQSSQQPSQQNNDQSQQNSDNGNEQSAQNQNQNQQSTQNSDANPEQADSSQSDEQPEEKNASDEQDQQAAEQREQNSDGEENDDKDQQHSAEQSQLVDAASELDESSEQWLRSIPDDPSGFLRRKFEYQSRQALQQQKQARDSNSQRRY